MSVLKALTVPFRTAAEGITLNASPAVICVMETTPDSNGDTVLETIVCKFTTREEAATIGSIVR
jgi:hypothetical protein